MKAAIIGAGLAGLAVCWHLAQYPEMQLTLFDTTGIAGGASGVSTGLLHPFPGRLALRSWQAWEGIRETENLLAVSEKAMGRPVAEQTGIFRPAIYERQRTDFQRCSEAKWEDASCFGPGLWIEEGITIYSRLYLDGLWKACSALGVGWINAKISSLSELDGFDVVVLAAGGGIFEFDVCKNLPLRATKGQTLICRWTERLPFSLVSIGHITPTEDSGLCQIGSTYEREYASLDPDPAVAAQLQTKAAQFYPPAKDFHCIEVRSGLRVARLQGYRPIVKKIDRKTWVFTGLGSRGMLYHAWLGKALAFAIAKDLSRLEPAAVFQSVCLDC